MIPNWAPLDEIYPVERKNDWAVENSLDDTKTLLYSGTLGLKHNPALLVSLAEQVIAAGQPVELVVVNEGPAVELLRERAAERRRTPEAAAFPALRTALRGAGQWRHPGGPPREGCGCILGPVQDPVLPVRRASGARADAGGEPRGPARRLVSVAACRARKRHRSCPQLLSGLSRCCGDGERRSCLGARPRGSWPKNEFALAECADPVRGDPRRGVSSLRRPAYLRHTVHILETQFRRSRPAPYS